jgi:folate-binding protein YgfZ
VTQDNTVDSAGRSADRDAYDAARHRSALVDRSDVGRLVVAGADRRSYLHGLLTNDIGALGPGQGCYAAYLTPQGRMITDLTVYELGDVVLLTLPRATIDGVKTKLEQFVFTEEVQIGDVSETFASVAVVGPQAAPVAAGVLGGVTEAQLTGLPAHGNLRAAADGEAVIVLRVTDAGVPGYELLIDRARMPELRARLVTAGAVALDPETAEAIRIEAGVPKFGRDMDEETIPLEAGIEARAISLTKGCYVGQEVIIRVLHRGHGRVARKLVGLLVDGTAAPAPGTPVLSSDGQEIGHVTSSAISPSIGGPIALAYVHRDYVEPGTPVAVHGTTAVTTRLPFRPVG